MSLGFEQAGFDIVYAIDNDGYHAAAHARNFPYGVTECLPVERVSAQHIRRVAGLEGTDIDLVFGGPPCQGFSTMGHRDAGDPRNSLVGEFVRLVGELRPKAFVMENVPGMQTGATRPLFEHALGQFKRLGYNVTEPVRELNASAFGVPQDRSRLFVIGLREDVGLAIDYPAEREAAPPTVAEALDGLPDVDEDPSLFREDWAAYSGEPTSRYASIARGLERDPDDLSRPRQYDATKVSGCLRTRHTEKTRQLYAATPPGEIVPGHKLPRLDPLGLCPTLRAGTDSQRGSHTAPRPVHPFVPRVITVREAARLHGYPDWFAFYPVKWHAYRQIGNSVVPQVARAVGGKIREALGLKVTAEGLPLVKLDERFRLPENRPKHERRISHVTELRPVVEFLFNTARKGGNGALIRSFSFEDIEQAMKVTGAKLSRIRPEKLLDVLARSRSAEEVLTLPLQYGYSIRSTAEGGEFVRRGEEGDLLEKGSISVRSHDLVSAKVLAVDDTKLQCRDFLGILTLGDVVNDLWGDDIVAVRWEQPSGNVSHGAHAIQVVDSSGDRIVGVLSVKGRNLPDRRRLAQKLARAGFSQGVLVAKLTKEHVFVLAFELRGKEAHEIRRVCYRLTTASVESDGNKQ